jgi:hypothetical protein
MLATELPGGSTIIDKVAADFEFEEDPLRQRITCCNRKGGYGEEATGKDFTDVHWLNVYLDNYFTARLVHMFWCVWLLRSKIHRKEIRLKRGCYQFSGVPN